MKPRLPSAHWTEEDLDIWERAENRLGVHKARRTIDSGVDADRRDAALMFRAALYRRKTIGVLLLQGETDKRWIDVGGYAPCLYRL